MEKSLKKDFKDNNIKLDTNSLSAFILGARFVNQTYRKNGFNNKSVIEEVGKSLEEVSDIIDTLGWG